MRVFLVDTHTSGHHLSYLRLFARAFAELEHDTTVISPASYGEITGDNFETSLRKVEVHTINEELQDFPGGGVTAFRKHIRFTWRSLKKIIDNTIEITGARPDLIFFSTIDPYLGPYTSKFEIDLLFPYRWSGLYMKPQNIVMKWQYSFLRKSLLDPNHLLRSDRCRTIGIFTEPSATKLFAVIKKPVIIFPDIVDITDPNTTFSPISEIIERAKGRTIVSLVGSQDRRKGIIALLQVAKQLPEDQFFFVFAGQLSKSSFSEDELLLINNIELPNAYFYLQRIVNESAFNAFVSISNIVYAAYIDFPFSSNLIGKAALYNKPILVTSGSYMESVVTKYRLGKSALQGNIQDICSNLVRMRSAEYISEFNLTNGCRKYISDNSYPVFREKLQQLLSFY